MKTLKQFKDKHGHDLGACCLLGRCGSAAKEDGWKVSHAIERATRKRKGKV